MAGQYLKDLFGNLTDEEIMARVKDGLTTEACEIACRELRSRGIEPPAVEEPAKPEEPPYLGDRVILARNLMPAEAHILASRLTASGIDAEPADVNTAQANFLWFSAIGGAKVRVPQSQLAQAQQILTAFRNGEFALKDDFDAGKAGE
ncbi:MAG: hypothetical protein LBI48_12855 [Burkholderiaceae bacterium]|nr:hypothetical protein [Burkholderiaceae bacterium]